MIAGNQLIFNESQEITNISENQNISAKIDINKLINDLKHLI